MNCGPLQRPPNSPRISGRSARRPTSHTRRPPRSAPVLAMTSSTSPAGMSPAWCKPPARVVIRAGDGPVERHHRMDEDVPILTSAIVLDNKTTARGPSSSVQQTPVRQAFCRTMRAAHPREPRAHQRKHEGRCPPALHVRSGFRHKQVWLPTLGRGRKRASGFPRLGGHSWPAPGCPSPEQSRSRESRRRTVRAAHERACDGRRTRPDGRHGRSVTVR